LIAKTVRQEVEKALAGVENRLDQSFEKNSTKFYNLVADKHVNTATCTTSPPSRQLYPIDLTRLLVQWSRGKFKNFKSQTQLQALDAIRSRQDHLLVVMPTGGGKSLLWQLPAGTFWSTKVSLIVVPFVALKQDITRHAAKLHLSCESWFQKMQKATSSVVLVSIEQLKLAEFQAFVRMLVHQRQLGQIVIDEAHLILTADNYRKDVIHLAQLYTLHVTITLLSATFPPQSVPHLKDFLHLRDLKIFRERTMVPSLVIEINVEDNEHAWKERILSMARRVQPWLEERNAQGVIFCQKKDECLYFAQCLAVPAYHAGLDTASREMIYKNWVTGQKCLVVATSAFGTGVDGPNVLCVIHAGIPYSMIDYLQEIGRAGRNGTKSYAIMFAQSQQYANVPGGDHKGIRALNDLVFSEKECRRLPMSHFNDGEFLSCALVGEMCDLCSKATGQQMDDQFTLLRDQGEIGITE
jgi:superfamily II DNA helicase RecQ